MQEQQVPAPENAPPAGTARLVREPEDRRVAGVCGGLADWLGLDSTTVRVVVVALALVAPWTVVAYLVAAIALPERRPDEPRVRAAGTWLGRVPQPLIVVVAVVVVLTQISGLWWFDPFPAGLALVCVGIWLLVRDRGDDGADSATTMATEGGAPDPFASGDESEGAGSRTDPDPPGSVWGSGSPADATEPFDLSGPFPPPPFAPPPGSQVAAPERRRRRDRPPSRLGLAVLAAVLIVLGVIWFMTTVGDAHISGHTMLSVALIVVGGGMVVSAWRGRLRLLPLVALVLVGMIAATELVDVPIGAGMSSRTIVVATPAELARPHELYAGDLDIIVTDAAVEATKLPVVRAHVGAGSLRVIVPATVGLSVDAHVGAGAVDFPHDRADAGGVDVDAPFTLPGPPGSPQLALDLSTGVGRVKVEVDQDA
jgi:phage shock protein PspC (stress-responsive transcriptional regulator)